VLPLDISSIGRRATHEARAPLEYCALAGWLVEGPIVPHNAVPESDETNDAGSDVNPRLIQ
jgi:hypothetical protein